MWNNHSITVQDLLLTLGPTTDVVTHWSPAGSAKDKRHLADDTATSETSLKNISSTGQEMEEGMSSF